MDHRIKPLIKGGRAMLKARLNPQACFNPVASPLRQDKARDHAPPNQPRGRFGTLFSPQTSLGVTSATLFSPQTSLGVTSATLFSPQTSLGVALRTLHEAPNQPRGRFGDTFQPPNQPRGHLRDTFQPLNLPRGRFGGLFFPYSSSRVKLQGHISSDGTGSPRLKPRAGLAQPAYAGCQPQPA
jgi:hypothetical protein